MEYEIYGFEIEDNRIADGEWKGEYRYKKEAFCIVEAAGETAGQLSHQVLTGEWKSLAAYGEMLLHKLSCKYLLLLWNTQEEEQLLCISQSRRVRALEFLDFMIPEFGLVKGTAACASGRISSVILQVKMAEQDITDTMEYFMKEADKYFRECDWIDAAEYTALHTEDIKSMKRYYKKAIPWAYVRSLDIVPEGQQISMKSLENESGLIITASPDTYIMIGCRGEIYDIAKETFLKTYEPTEEKLDVFGQMLDFLPAVETVPEGSYISLDEMAHLCYPKAGAGIYARELTCRTKIFPADKEQEYFLGRPGDYLAVRAEDFCDIYVIQRDIFLQSYEEG